MFNGSDWRCFFCTHSAKNISQIINLCVPFKFIVSFGFYLRTI